MGTNIDPEYMYVEVENRKIVTFSIPMVTEDYSNATMTVQGEIGGSIYITRTSPYLHKVQVHSITVHSLYSTLPMNVSFMLSCSKVFIVSTLFHVLLLHVHVHLLV